MDKPEYYYYQDVFISKAGTEVVVYEIEKVKGCEAIIKYENIKSGDRDKLFKSDFHHCFKPKKDVKEEAKFKKNINQDILKLIEAGYEFSSFWGDTVDGRSINIDLNEEEIKQ